MLFLEWSEELRKVEAHRDRELTSVLERSATPRYAAPMANIEVSSDVLDRIEAEASRRQVTATEVIAELADQLPPVRSASKSRAPSFVGAGASSSGITNRIYELLADGFGRD